jgi:hypothetical protein
MSEISLNKSNSAYYRNCYRTFGIYYIIHVSELLSYAGVKTFKENVNRFCQ